MADQFDAMLITDCDILRRATTLSPLHQKQATPAKIATVKCRVSMPSAGGSEKKVGKKTAFDHPVIFMRPYAGLNTKDWLQPVGFPLMNVINIRNPSNLDHHYEVDCEVIEG